MTQFEWTIDSKISNLRMALDSLDAVASVGRFSTRTVSELDYAIRSLELTTEQLKRDRAALAKRQHNMGVAA